MSYSSENELSDGTQTRRFHRSRLFQGKGLGRKPLGPCSLRVGGFLDSGHRLVLKPRELS